MCRARASLSLRPLTHPRLAGPNAGGGHFSPIGGYHAGADAALVLDVARFKYPPYWVPLPRLWEASLVVDDDTGKSRGWFSLAASPNLNPVRQ